MFFNKPIPKEAYEDAKIKFYEIVSMGKVTSPQIEVYLKVELAPKWGIEIASKIAHELIWG